MHFFFFFLQNRQIYPLERIYSLHAQISRPPATPSPSLPFPSLPFPSLPFPSLPFPTLPFPSLPIPSRPVPSRPVFSLPPSHPFDSFELALAQRGRVQTDIVQLTLLPPQQTKRDKIGNLRVVLRGHGRQEASYCCLLPEKHEKTNIVGEGGRMRESLEKSIDCGAFACLVLNASCAPREDSSLVANRRRQQCMACGYTWRSPLQLLWATHPHHGTAQHSTAQHSTAVQDGCDRLQERPRPVRTIERDRASPFQSSLQPQGWRNIARDCMSSIPNMVVVKKVVMLLPGVFCYTCMKVRKPRLRETKVM